MAEEEEKQKVSVTLPNFIMLPVNNYWFFLFNIQIIFFLFCKVAKKDFKTINELAESAILVRCKDLNPQKIKSARKKLLQK